MTQKPFGFALIPARPGLRIALLSLVLCLLFAGTASAGYVPGPDDLSFHMEEKIMPALRVDVEFQKAFRGNWKKPGLPLSLAAKENEEGRRPQGGGFCFGLLAEGMTHSIDDKDDVCNFARVDGTEFSEGKVLGEFTFGRGDFGLRFGLFTPRQIFSIRIGLSMTYLRINGKISGSDLTRDFRHDVFGVGIRIGLELAVIPVVPSLRLYADFSGWDGGGGWSGSGLEAGVKLRMMGVSIFLGLRRETACRDLGSQESELDFRSDGVVAGIGLTF
jgi:hypothetical protein